MRGVILILIMSGLAIGQTWTPVESRTQVGRAVITIDEPDHLWRYLLLKWASSCPGPRSLTINGGVDRDPASFLNRVLQALPASGQIAVFVPKEASHVTVAIEPGGCDATTQIDLFSTSDSINPALCADPTPDLSPSRSTPASRPERVTADKAPSGEKRPKPPKAPKSPTQPEITKGCVVIFDIYSHSLGLFSGILTPEPGLEAKIRNTCSGTVQVFLHVGYFDSRRTQFGDGILSATVAPGAVYPVYHVASLYGLERGALKLAKVIAVDAFPQ